MKTKNIFTTVSRYVAKKGYSFEFLGVAEVCQSCVNVKICLGRLEEGELYSITEVGKNKMKCPLISEDSIVVEVNMAPRLLAVSARSAVVGTTLRVQALERAPCSNLCLCLPNHVKVGRKYVVLRVIRKTFDCPFGSSRALVEVEPV